MTDKDRALTLSSLKAPKARGPRAIGNCWEIADKNIAHFKEARDNGTGHPLVCQDKIDQWLEYRFRHGPDDVAVL